MSLYLTGIEEIDGKLATLKESSKKKISRASINAGLTVVAGEIRKRAPKKKGGKKKGGTLKKSIGKKFKADKKRDEISARVGINVAKKKSDKEKWAPHGHLVTLGTKQRNHNGANRGRMTANNFVPSGVAASTAAMRSKMIMKADQALAKELAKLK